MKSFLLFSKTFLRDKEHLFRVLFMTALMLALVFWGTLEEQAYLKQIYFLCSAWSLAVVVFILGYSYCHRDEAK